jgi:hypothetical protein
VNSKWALYILIVVLGAAVVIIKTCKNKKQPEPKPRVTNNDPSSKVNRDRGFDRRISYLEYSKHAKCRMECRHITESEVEDIMQNGDINYYKSDIKNAPAPGMQWKVIQKTVSMSASYLHNAMKRQKWWPSLTWKPNGNVIAPEMIKNT